MPSYGPQDGPNPQRSTLVGSAKTSLHVNISKVHHSYSPRPPGWCFTVVLDICDVLLLILLLLKCEVADASTTRGEGRWGAWTSAPRAFLTEIIEMVIRLPHLQLER